MSNRTIIEFNHDLAQRIHDEPLAFALELSEYLRSTSHASRDRLKRYGARTLATIHHTDEVSIQFNHKP